LKFCILREERSHGNHRKEEYNPTAFRKFSFKALAIILDYREGHMRC